MNILFYSYKLFEGPYLKRANKHPFEANYTSVRLSLETADMAKGYDVISVFTGEDLNDEILKKLMNMPNVLITPHQAFATVEALTNIAESTFYNIGCWAYDLPSRYELPERDAEIYSFIDDKC